MGTLSRDPEPIFSDADVERLDAFLSSEDADVAWMQVDEIHGMVTALVCGPGPVAPGEWMETVWGGKPPVWKSTRELEEITGLLLRMWNDVAARVEAGEGFTPIVEKVWDEADEEEMVGGGWCEGFVTGVEMKMSSWGEHDPELDRLLAPIYAVAGLIESDELDELMRERGYGEALMDAATQSVYELHAYWKKKEPARQTGGDDPCPCGSGKAFKLCCGLVH